MLEREAAKLVVEVMKRYYDCYELQLVGLHAISGFVFISCLLLARTAGWGTALVLPRVPAELLNKVRALLTCTMLLTWAALAILSPFFMFARKLTYSGNSSFYIKCLKIK